MQAKTLNTFNILICLAFSLFCLSFNTSEIEKESEKTMQIYKRCLIDGDKNLIKNITDKSFRAGIYQQPISSQMFGSFLDMVQLPDSVFWGDLKHEEGKFFRNVYYVFGENKINSNVTFSNSGKILFSDWIDQKGLGIYREKKSEYITSIPFKLKNGKIIISAKLNNSDKVLNMIFDTGADGMALVKSLKDECNIEITRKQTTNVPGGQMQVNMSENNTLILDSISIPNQNLVLFEKIAEDIDGLIGGANLFRQYITEIDFDNSKIKLYTLGKFSPSKEYKSSDMKYENGIPTVEFNIYKDSHKFKSEFIFDTGAGYSAILFGSGMKHLKNDSIEKIIHPQYFSYNHSLGNKSKISIGQTDSICFTNMCFENANLAMESYNPNAHSRHNVMGSIGIKSLEKFNWIIDLIDYKIYTSENESTHLPMDFVLDGYLLGYDNKQLKVIRSVSSDKNENFNIGDIVLSLGKTRAEELNSDKLNKILRKRKIDIRISKNKTGNIEKLIIKQH